jgi:hypothetical protein
MLRRALSLASSAALRASVAQLPPSALPAAGIAVRYATKSASREDAVRDEWASVRKARGSSKTLKPPGKGKQAARPDGHMGGSGSGAAPAPERGQAAHKSSTAEAAAAVAPARRVVDVPDRVSVKELARALEVPVARVEAVMGELDDAPVTEEECVPSCSGDSAALCPPFSLTPVHSYLGW